MRQVSTHMAVVLDEHGGTAGIIAIQDIFEEVIGEIDESLTRPSIEVSEPGSATVDGTVRLDEIADALDVSLDEEDVVTLSGLVLERLGRPPRVGDRFIYGQISVEVIKVKGRGARTCLVRKRGQDEAQDKKN
jgi:CBS domain containing-hemolysin-like protein